MTQINDKQSIAEIADYNICSLKKTNDRLHRNHCRQIKNTSYLFRKWSNLEKIKDIGY
jgi:hypothetical protein